jgi:glycosyltransferase involved in cell wall biosynthesis
MKIQLVHDGRIPVSQYGGTERVIWYLGRELARMGHRVSYLVPVGSHCDFGEVQALDPGRPVEEQTDPTADIVHFQAPLSKAVEVPHVVTVHGNIGHTDPLDRNCIFVSADHARRHNSDSFVYNGLDWDDYGPVDPDAPRSYYHFLGKAAWRVKNVQGAIDTIRAVPGERLYVLGGTRLNFKMGFRLTLSPRVRFFGMVGGEEKLRLLRESKGLVFPVCWPEPFGLAITESLWFGCPVFGTPYGSLPELVTAETGFLSNRKEELAYAIRHAAFDRKTCHEYARDRFNARVMAEEYLTRYERVLNGEFLNPTPPRALKPHDWPLPWEG